MRIATYNLWNSTTNWARRLAAIVEELTFLDADIVALQEAPTQARDRQSLVDFFREETDYPHVIQLEEPEAPDEGERPEGLAFISKLPFEAVRTNWERVATNNNWAMKIAVDWKGRSLGVTNVHLDYRQASSREQHIARIVRELIDSHSCDYEILCGDFNDELDSLLARFLEGRASIEGYRTQWRDLAYAWHANLGESPPVTLDFLNNPRWQDEVSNETPARFDRLYLRTSESSLGIQILQAGIFGREPHNRFGIIPSDHYGVFVDLQEPDAI